ncbi:hypothetical protein [Psychrobacter fjordensis]|uniref:hypothetical protein n=1 Tax=Psychrobacter fjordensis TaxID=664424 RepID=UPI001917C221|nr:hypothetical protein [Psychrobacter fjordensis]
MTISNDQPATNDKRNKLNKNLKLTERLSFATWILLIISFTLLAFALYSILIKTLETPNNTHNVDVPESTMTEVK